MAREIDRQFRIVAGAPNGGDLLHLLELMGEDVQNIGVPLGIDKADDSLALRRAVHSVLQKSIDKLKALRENNKQQGRPRDTDDDDTLSMGDGDADSDLL